jgi:hypothetical protein
LRSAALKAKPKKIFLTINKSPFFWRIGLDFTPLEIMPRCSAAGLDFTIIPAGFNAPLEFLTGFTFGYNLSNGPP